MSLSLLVSPTGHLRPDPTPPRPAPLSDEAAVRLTVAFSEGEGPGLLHLGAAELDTPLPPTLAFFRELGRSLLGRVCQLAEPEQALAAGEPAAGRGHRRPPAAEPAAHDAAPNTSPPIACARWWAAIRQALLDRVSGQDATVESVLRRSARMWSAVGRVHFHLAENREDPERPFAFLATYTTGLGDRGKVQHAPLGQALRQYAGARNRMALLSLLSPVERAAGRCEWVRALVDSGRVYQPLAWKPAEALALLRDVEALEQAGVVVRVPARWGRRRPPRAVVQVSVGGKAAGRSGRRGAAGLRRVGHAGRQRQRLTA